MKKILCILFVLLLAAGCSSKNHYSYVSEGDEVLISGPNKYSYTKNDLYASLKKASEGAITNEILTRIARNIEGIDLDSIYADAGNLIETYVSMGYESYIVASYGSLEAYRQSYISSLILSELSKQYARENYDTLVADKKPVKMQIATFENLEDAEKCIEDVKNGSTFDMAAVNNNAAMRRRVLSIPMTMPAWLMRSRNISIRLKTPVFPRSLSAPLPQPMKTEMQSMSIPTIF